MNFTLAILGGLTLVLPGLLALLAVHQQSGRDGARRIDIPLTSTLGLAVVMGVSLIAHFVGWAFFELGIAVAREMQAHWTWMDHAWGVALNPYDTAVQLAEGGKPGLGEILAFVMTVAAEAVFAMALVMSRGFALVAAGVDFGNSGWLFPAVVVPIRNGLQPVAYVLTTPQGDGSGFAYRGVIVEARQGADGELKGLTLNSVEAFGYKLPATSPPAGTAAPGSLPDLTISTSARRALEGVLDLEAAQIRNVLILTVGEDTVADLLQPLPDHDITADEDAT